MKEHFGHCQITMCMSREYVLLCAGVPIWALHLVQCIYIPSAVASCQ
jgi:hypothetical protein